MSDLRLAQVPGAFYFEFMRIPLILTALIGFGLTQAEIRFNRDVRPILSNHCYACHGFDAAQRKADLRLDVLENAIKKGGNGAAIVPGHPEESLLVKRIRHKDPEEVMPPRKFNKDLSDSQRELLEQWIREGAKWEDHWSFTPLQRPAVPMSSAGTKSPWVRNPIDAFVLRKLEGLGVKPSEQASDETLARRLSLDLCGLPPTRDQIEQFAAIKDEAGFEAFVDRLLDSSAYGERMAVFWLDLVRFADTNGIHGDQHRELDVFRDYVILAFNNNMPFDRFTREQLGGDLMGNPTRDQKIASGYNRLLMTTQEGGAQPKEYTAKYAADRVRNVSTAWLGITMGCAECHDHKYDPIKTRDFYQLAAFFADVKEVPVGVQPPNLYVTTPGEEKRLAALDAEVARLKETHATSKSDDDKKKFEAKKKERDQFKAGLRKTLITESVKPRVIRVLARGNWQDDSGEIVGPAAPDFLPPLKTDKKRPTRLDLGHWLVSSDNPLTARVLVNRLWRLCFGEALARTLDDVGFQGSWPTHPELLDWLAVELIESGWDVKHVLRLMATSSAYRQSSGVTRKQMEADPHNAWLARQARFRLDAEFIRDYALATSGLLVNKVGGRSVKPYQPAGYWAQLNFPKRKYRASTGDDQFRRGVYTYWCRTFLHPSLSAFDAPTREECTAERVRSNTPLQALVLLNDPTYVEAARQLGETLAREKQGAFPRRTQWLYRQVLARSARDEELPVLKQVFDEALERYGKDPEAAETLLKVGQSPAPEGDDTAAVAAWTTVARVVLNLNETITRN